jgi:selenocysteine lyase/cysteine desulfurase
VAEAPAVGNFTAGVHAHAFRPSPLRRDLLLSYARLSASIFNTPEEVDRALAAVRSLTAA